MHENYIHEYNYTTYAIRWKILFCSIGAEIISHKFFREYLLDEKSELHTVCHSLYLTCHLPLCWTFLLLQCWNTCTPPGLGTVPKVNINMDVLFVVMLHKIATIIVSKNTNERLSTKHCTSPLHGWLMGLSKDPKFTDDVGVSNGHLKTDGLVRNESAALSHC